MSKSENPTSKAADRVALAREKTIGVIGAGTMGAGIAQVVAGAGHPVRLFDTRAEAAARALGRTDAALQRLVSKGRMSAHEKEALTARIEPCSELRELAGSGLVVEAIVENLQVKRGLFAELEALVDDNAILATNTSSISVTAIGADLRCPERLVGMHFFNPAPLMALVEVVSGLATNQAVADTVFDTALAWGKEPVHARSTPGFIVNRVARPFYAEALRVLGEGAADVATLDAVMRECGGFRMGPFELMDLIGQDVNFSVTQSVYDAYFQDPRFTPSLIQQELVLGGYLGRKTGRGFYDYSDGVERPTPRVAARAGSPSRITAVGELGPLESLIPLCCENGMTIEREPGEEGLLVLDGRVVVALSDGRTATERMARGEDRPLVLVDLANDYTSAPRVALCKADQVSEAESALAIGLFQALDKSVSLIDDCPGMLVLRSVCMLANEAADAVNQSVCSVSDVDTAMRKGVNYPEGPLAWAERIGLDRVVDTLDNLAKAYGEDRYRVSPLLRRKFYSGTRF